MFGKQQSILEGLHNTSITQFGKVNEAKKSVKEDTTLDFHEAEAIKSFLDATGITSIPDVDSIIEFENEFNDYFGTPFDELSQQEQDLVLSNVEEILGVDDSNDADVEESVVSDTVNSAIKDETTEMNSLDDIPVEEINNTENITVDDIEKEDDKDATSNTQEPKNVVEAAVDEDEWKTMHGAHILIDGDGDIVAGGPEHMRKGNKKSEVKVSKDISKNLKSISKLIKIPGVNKGSGDINHVAPRDWLPERRQHIKKAHDNVKNQLRTSAKSKEDKDTVEAICKALDKAYDAGTKAFDSGNYKGLAGSSYSSDFEKSLQDLGVAKDESRRISRKLLG